MESHFAHYIGKFCFDWAPNNTEGERVTVGFFRSSVTGVWEEEPPARSRFTHGPPCWGPCETDGRLFIMAFDDERHHWLRAREFWSDLTCEERHHLASWVGLVQYKPGNASVVTVHVRQAIRPRFWYFAFVNCGASILKPVSFSVHALNELQGFQAEFGMDVRGSMPLEATFSLLFLLLLLASFAVLWTREARLNDSAGRRPLLRLLQISAGCSAAGCGCRALHHYIFSFNGLGLEEAQVLGTLFACAAKASFTLLQFLVARGWALLETPDERHHRYAIVGMLGAVIVLSVGCEIHEQYFHDQSTSFYLYESWTGILILALNLLLLASAWLFTWQTYSKEAALPVRNFYRLVSAACGIHFACLPLMCLLAGSLHPWVRRKYVERSEIGARFAATVLVWLCLWPSRLDALLAARLKNRQQPKLLAGDEPGGEEELQATADRGGTLERLG